MNKAEEIAKRFLGDGHRFYGEVFESGIYDPVKELGELDVVLDIGACNGSFSLWIYDKAKEIHAIEPYPPAYEILENTCKDLPKIKTHNLAIWEHNDKVYIEGAALGAATTRAQESQNNIESFEAQGITLNTFLEQNNIKHVDVLKTDAESAEHTYFRADDAGKALEKIDYIIGEHLDGLKGGLEKNGFKFSTFNHGYIFKK